MSIFFNEEKNIFTLQTKNSTYQMKVDEFDFLIHLYYGNKIEQGNMEYLITKTDISFSGNPFEANDRTFSLDVIPQEYSSVGIESSSILEIASLIIRSL